MKMTKCGSVDTLGEKVVIKIDQTDIVVAKHKT